MAEGLQEHRGAGGEELIRGHVYRGIGLGGRLRKLPSSPDNSACWRYRHR
jgi:hypothetical protein